MAVVGSAEIVVRAITLKVADDIKKAFADARPSVAAAGKEHGKAYLEGFNGASDKLPLSIEQALKRTNSRQIAREKGDDFTGTFQQRINLINVDKALDKMDGSAAGDRVGDSVVKAVVSHMESLSGEAENILGKAGERGGRSMGDGIDSGTRSSSRRVVQTLTQAGNDGGGGFARGFLSKLPIFDKGFQDSAKAAAQGYKIALASAQTLGTGILTLVSGLSSLVSALFAVGSAVAPAAGAIGALPGVMFAAAQAGIALKLAMSGVGKAITAGLAAAAPAANEASSASKSAAKAIRNAMEGIADANRTTARAVVDAQARIVDAQRAASRAIKDAKDDLKSAYADAARAAAEAAQKVADAERDVGDAQRQVRIAQLALTDARKAGAESLQQLGFSAEGAALSEQRAGIALQEAYAKLQAVQNAPADSKQRIEAELTFKEAELHFRESKDRASDLKKEEEKAAKSGVDGTKQVVDAKNDILKAKNDEIEAENKLAKARQDQANTTIDNSNKINAAQAKVTQAQINGAKSVADAEKGLARAREDGAIRLAKAMQALRDAQASAKDAAAKGTPAQLAYNKAIKDLSPEAKAFVKYMIGIHDEILKVKAAAGENLFPKLQTALEPIVSKLFPVFEDKLRITGGLLGDAAIKISKVVTSADGIKKIEKIFDGNNKIIKIGGDVLGHLTEIFLDLLIAVQPVTLQFVKFIDQLTEGWAESLKTGDGMEKLTGFFTEGGKVASKLWGIFKQLWGIIMTLGGAAKGSGNDLLDSFKGALTNLQKLLTTAAKDGSLKKFFEQAADTAKTIFSIIGKVAGGLLKLGGSAEAGDAFKSVREAIPYFTTIVDTMKKSMPAFGRLFKAVARIFAAFTAGDSTTSLFDTLTGLANKFADILEGPIIQSLLKQSAFFLGILHAVGLLIIGARLVGKVVFGLLLPLGKVFKVLGLIGKAPLAIIGAIGKLLLKIPLLGKAFAAVGKVAQGIGDKLPGGKGRKERREAKAAGGGAAGDAGTDKFSGNLKNLSKQFDKTGDAKDKFIKNLQGLSTQFGKTGGAADDAAGTKPKRKAKKGSAASQAGTVGNLDFKINYPSPAAVKKASKKLGLAVSDGFSDGILSAPAVRKMKKMTDDVIEANKRMLGIASPSKVFEGIGQDIGAGMVNGMKDKTGAVTAEAKDLAKAATKGANAGVGSATSAATGGLGGGTNTDGKGRKGKRGKKGKIDKKGLGLDIVSDGLSALPGPLGLIASTLIPLLITGFKLLYDNFKPFKTFIDGIVVNLKDLGRVIIDKAMVAFQAIGDFVTTKVLPALQVFGGWLVEKLTPAFRGISDFIVLTVVPAFQRLGTDVLTALQPIIDFITTKLIPAIVPTLTAIKDFIVTQVVPILQVVLPAAFAVLKGIFMTGFAIISTVIKVAIAVIVFVFTKILIPLFSNVIIPLIKFLFKIFQVYFGLIRTVITAVFNAIKWVWNNVLKPTFILLRDTIVKIVNNIKTKFQEFKDKWAAIIGAIKDYWNKYGKPFIEDVRSRFNEKIEAIKTIIQKIKDKFTDVIGGIKAFWAKTGQKVIDDIAGKFTKFGEGITKIWEAIKDAPKNGLRNLINNLNNWLVTPLNTLTSKFGLDIPKIPMPKGLAEGGEVTGKGGPKDDREIRRVSPGEWVIRESSARRIGRQQMAFMNRTGQLPIPGGSVSTRTAGPRGGVISDAKDSILDKLKSGKEKIDSLLAKGAGFALEQVMSGFKNLLPKGSGFIEELVRKIFEKATSNAKTFGDTEQKKIDDAEAADDFGGGSGSAGGKTGARGVWNALRSSGLNEIKAAGIMGNMQTESYFKWNIVQGGRLSNTWKGHGGAGYGLVQWTPAAKLGAMLGGRQNNLTNQIKVLVEQLRGKHGKYSESRAGGMLNRAKSVGAAARAFMLGYERPANKSKSAQAQRASRAAHWYKVMKGSQVPDGDAPGGGGGTVPVGGGSSKRTSWHGGRFTTKFVAHLQKAQSIAGVNIHVTQGGFRPRTSYSGATHGGDALDTRVSNALIRALRKVGIAAGDRTGKGNWAPHVHAVPGPGAGYGSPSARRQYADYIRRGGAKQSLRSAWGLASGGTVRATSGGILANIAEGGKNERVEPLDSSGLSNRDRALIELLSRRNEPAAAPVIDVQVFIGDKELTDMVDLRLKARDKRLAQDLSVGAKRRYLA